jgi:tetratricopeptide (TPR) repeat protein
MQQKTDGARSVFCDAVKIVRTKLGYDDWHVASIQSQIGYIYFQVGDFEFALHAFADALAVHRANVNRGAIAETLCSIGSIHLEQKSFDPAIECFLEALHVSFSYAS